MIEQGRLEALFVIDLDAGKLFWKCVSKFHNKLNGKEAGCARKNSHGDKNYWYVKIDGNAYKRSAIILALKTGKWPVECVDHINGNSLDDRAENLRHATRTENAWNHKGRRKKSPYPMGVRKLNGKFHARIGYNKVPIHIGVFETPELASAAYQQKRKELFHEFA